MTTLQPTTTRGMPAAVLLLVGWFAVALLLGAADVFSPSAGTPPITIGLAAVGPPLLVGALLIRSQRLRDWARSLDLRFLTLLQMWRVAGFAFLELSVVGVLAADFAIPAGVGDMAVGITAPFVAALLIGGGRPSRIGYLGWTAFGALDLVMAVSLGVLHSDSVIGLLRDNGPNTDIMSSLPMSLIPTFAVPLALTLHIIALVTMWGPSWRKG